VRDEFKTSRNLPMLSCISCTFHCAPLCPPASRAAKFPPRRAIRRLARGECHHSCFFPACAAAESSSFFLSCSERQERPTEGVKGVKERSDAAPSSTAHPWNSSSHTSNKVEHCVLDMRMRDGILEMTFQFATNQIFRSEGILGYFGQIFGIRGAEHHKRATLTQPSPTSFPVIR